MKMLVTDAKRKLGTADGDNEPQNMACLAAGCKGAQPKDLATESTPDSVRGPF